MKLVCVQAGIGTPVGTEFPVLKDCGLYWLIVVGLAELKVFKSTMQLRGKPKGGPVFAPKVDSEPVSVEVKPEPAPQVRRRGRPSTGKALTPAQKQARYRQRQAEKTVTVTFKRADMSALKLLLANPPAELSLAEDVISSLAQAVFDADLAQRARR